MPNNVFFELLIVIITIVGIAVAVINFVGLSVYILNENIKSLELLPISAMTLNLCFMSKFFIWYPHH